MLFDCSKMTQYRESCGLGPFIRAHRILKQSITSIKLYALYLNDRDVDTIKKKAMDLYVMKVGWHKLMKIDL